MYDVVHQNIIFEAQLKDGGALDLPSGTLHVLCVETDDLHLYLFKGVGYIVDPLLNNPWVDGDGGNYAHRAFDEDMLDAKKPASRSLSPFGTAGTEGYGLEN